MSEEKVWGGGKKRGTDIEELQNKKKKKNGRQVWIHCDKRVKAYSFQAVPKCLIPNWLFFFFFCFVLENNKEAIKSMYTAVSAIQVAVQFKDVHGVAFHCDHCCS